MTESTAHEAIDHTARRIVSIEAAEKHSAEPAEAERAAREGIATADAHAVLRCDGTVVPRVR